jgi:hypothetical protein
MNYIANFKVGDKIYKNIGETSSIYGVKTNL